MRIDHRLDFTHLDLPEVEHQIANFQNGPDDWAIDDAQMYNALIESRDKLRAAHPKPVAA